MDNTRNSKIKRDWIGDNWSVLRWSFVILGVSLSVLCYFNINKSEFLPSLLANISWEFFGVPGAALLVNGIVNWTKWLPKVPNQTLEENDAENARFN